MNILTISREPVSRFISHYNTYLCHRESDWVPECIRHARGPEALLDHTMTEWGGNSFAQSLCMLEAELLQIKDYPDSLLEDEALRIVRERLFFAGILEHFDASLLAVSMLLGHTGIRYWRQHSRSSEIPGAVRKEELSPLALQRIADAHAIDARLHEGMKGWFEETFADVLEFCRDEQVSLQYDVGT